MRSRRIDAPVVVGQVWRDRDKRIAFRDVEVVRVDDANAYVFRGRHAKERGKETRLSLTTLRLRYDLCPAPSRPTPTPSDVLGDTGEPSDG